jgi:hypothetical protein
MPDQCERMQLNDDDSQIEMRAIWIVGRQGMKGVTSPSMPMPKAAVSRGMRRTKYVPEAVES